MLEVDSGSGEKALTHSLAFMTGGVCPSTETERPRMQMVLWTLLYALRDCRELNMSPGAVTPCKAACPSQAPMWNQSSFSRSGEVATMRALLCCPACHL